MPHVSFLTASVKESVRISTRLKFHQTYGILSNSHILLFLLQAPTRHQIVKSNKNLVGVQTAPSTMAMMVTPSFGATILLNKFGLKDQV